MRRAHHRPAQNLTMEVRHLSSAAPLLDTKGVVAELSFGTIIDLSIDGSRTPVAPRVRSDVQSLEVHVRPKIDRLQQVVGCNGQ